MNQPLPHAVVVTNPGSSAATWSLVFGILTWFCLPVVGAIAAVALGLASTNTTRRYGLSPRGTAVAGIVLGAIQLGAIVLLGLLAVIGEIQLHALSN